MVADLQWWGCWGGFKVFKARLCPVARISGRVQFKGEAVI